MQFFFTVFFAPKTWCFIEEQIELICSWSFPSLHANTVTPKVGLLRISPASERHPLVLEAQCQPLREAETLAAGALSQITLLSSRATNFSRV